MKFHWSEYKSSNDSRSVQFPGGFHLYVMQTDRGRRVTGKWRVTWYLKGEEVPSDEMPGLTDQNFGTRVEAQRAAERVFWPIMKIAPQLVHFNVNVDLDNTPWKAT